MSLILLACFYFCRNEKENLEQLSFLNGSTVELFSTQDENYHEDPNDYLIVRNRDITTNNYHSPYGFITQEGENRVCKCQNGYANYPNEGISGEYCTYKQSKQMTSFLLELFIPIGIGHFIIGSVGLGIGKLFYIFIPCVICALTLCCGEGCKPIISIIGYILEVGFGVWYIFDLVLFGINNYRDSNTVPLKAW